MVEAKVMGIIDIKKTLIYLFATFIAGFGLLTLFLSTSVIFDLFGIRAKEGNYVLFVVWSNFISSILYLFAAYGIIKNKKWATTLLMLSSILLIIAFIGLKYYISLRGIYENKTISAMIFRITVTIVITIIAYFTIKNKIMNNIKILIPVLSLFLFSCGNSSNEKSNEKTEIVSHEEHQNNTDMQSIDFNNGEKWKVDDNMSIQIRNMENEVISFAKYEKKNYKTLSEKLSINLDLLTSNCTMSGKAHDELHKWLLPYIDLVNELTEVKNDTEASRLFENIQISFTTFNKYFQ